MCTCINTCVIAVAGSPLLSVLSVGFASVLRWRPYFQVEKWHLPTNLPFPSLTDWLTDWLAQPPTTNTDTPSYTRTQTHIHTLIVTSGLNAYLYTHGSVFISDVCTYLLFRACVFKGWRKRSQSHLVLFIFTDIAFRHKKTLCLYCSARQVSIALGPWQNLLGRKHRKGLLFVSSLLYLQPQALVLFLLWIGWWTEIFPFMLFQHTQLSVNKRNALCVSTWQWLTFMNWVNIFQSGFSLLIQMFVWIFLLRNSVNKFERFLNKQLRGCSLGKQSVKPTALSYLLLAGQFLVNDYLSGHQ